MEFKQIVSSRYAVKKFDGKTVPKEKMDQLLEIIRLAPSSYNIQPWKIKVITDPKVKAQLTPVSYNQAQIESCSHLMVFCTDTNLDALVSELKGLMVTGGISAEVVEYYNDALTGKAKSMPEEKKVAWLKAQTIFAVSNALNGAKSLGLDSCPMEGFNPAAYSKILNLPANLIPIVLVPVGYAADKPSPKLRFPEKKIFI